MGTLIIISPAPPASDLTRWRIKRSSTQTGTFSTIATRTISSQGLAYYDLSSSSTDWYKTSYLLASGSEEEDETDAFQPQFEKYTTIRKVERFLRIPTVTNDTTPNISDMAELIQRTQDLIDYRCLEENTRIHTGSDYIKIKDIKEGDKVFTYDLKEKKIVESKVKRLIDNGEKEVYSLRCMNREIKAIEDHLFLIAKKTVNPMKEIYDKFIKEDNYKESNVKVSKK